MWLGGCRLLQTSSGTCFFLFWMSTITFVTGNANKLREVVAILGGVASEGGSVVGRHTITNHKLDLEEVQGLIEEVTVYKARKAAELLNGPVLVEDTCLGFSALGDLPGPYIKWFVEGCGLEGLVKMLVGFEDKLAKAYCTFGYCAGPGQEVQLFQGVTEGSIVASRGPTNFGWDLVFQPKGFVETYAEMEAATKNLISHRYRALTKVKAFLEQES